jgi:hypothetical protein
MPSLQTESVASAPFDPAYVRQLVGNWSGRTS